MSTLRVSSINNAAASAGGIAIDSSGNVTGALPAPNRNLLYNGAMQVSQRGTSVTGNTAGGYLTADRWDLGLGTLGTWTNTVENDGPTGSGLTRSWKVLCTTADAAPAASDLMFCIQRLEGQDLQRIRKGTSSAQKLTLSFWVKSNVTGTYTVRLADNDNNRNVAATYSISASATWEKKTITFPADTTGALDNDGSTSMFVAFWLGAGSDYKSGTTPTTWKTSATGDIAAGLTVNLAAATNNYWQVTGVQLEVGDAATDFEFKSYGQELRDCQRYYERFGGTGIADLPTTLAQIDVPNRPEVFLNYSTKRTSPQISVLNPTNLTVYFVNKAGSVSVSSYGGTYVGTTANTANLFFFVASGVAAYDLCLLTNSGNAIIEVSAEL